MATTQGSQAGSSWCSCRTVSETQAANCAHSLEPLWGARVHALPVPSAEDRQAQEARHWRVGLEAAKGIRLWRASTFVRWSHWFPEEAGDWQAAQWQACETVKLTVWHRWGSSLQLGISAADQNILIVSYFTWANQIDLKLVQLEPTTLNFNVYSYII